MVGIQYQHGKEQTIKLLKSIIKAVEKDKVSVMDIELQAKGIIEVEFECYECGYSSSKLVFRNEDVSSICDQCHNRSDVVRHMNIKNVKRIHRKKERIL